MSDSYFNNQDILERIWTHPIITISSLTTLLFALLVLYRRGDGKKYKLPPGPTGVPILGYLPFLGREPFKELDRLKNIYGNIFSISMGLTRVVILGDFEAVKEAFSKSTVLGRPNGLFDFLPDGVGFGGITGEEWSEQRKFCVKTLRGHGIGRDKWESIVEIEVADFIQLISSYNGEPFNVSKMLMSSISNNISTFVFGKRLPFNHPDRKFLDSLIAEIYAHFDQSSILAFFPAISNILVALGMGRVARTHKRMTLFNKFFRKEAEKIKESYKNSEEDNFIADYLKEMDSDKGKSVQYFNEKNLFGNIQLLFLAGSDTSSVSLSWLLLAMVKFPDVQTKVQQEVDSVLGKDGRILWSDRNQLPYTYATILEGQRWRTLVPLNVARLTTEDIQIKGYCIPKGTTVLANFWGLHNDTRYWKEPEKFEPRRFLTKDGKEVILKPDSFVPFSYGKRNCPGDVIALMEILMYFTSIMQKFTVLIPEGKSVNLDGKTGLTYHNYAQELRFVPRVCNNA